MAEKRDHNAKGKAALLAAILQELGDSHIPAPKNKEDGESHQMRVSCPCTRAEAAEMCKILLGLRDLAYEHLVVELEPNPTGLDCVQTIVENDGVHLMVEAMTESGTDNARIFRAENLTREEGIRTFLEICYRAKVPAGSRWRDVTKEVLG